MPPTDADVEHLRRAMVDAHQTWEAVVNMVSPARGLARDRYMLLLSELDDLACRWESAAVAWSEARRARPSTGFGTSIMAELRAHENGVESPLVLMLDDGTFVWMRPEEDAPGAHATVNGARGSWMITRPT